MDAARTLSDMFIDLVSLVPVPPHLMNRDDKGRTKFTTIHGTDRDAVASQSIKRSLRRSTLNGEVLHRSRHLPRLVGEILTINGKPLVDTEGNVTNEEAMSVLSGITFNKTDKELAKYGATNGTILFSDSEITLIAEALQDKPTKDWRKAFEKALKDPSIPVRERLLIALYGRMSTNNDMKAMPDGALQVPWAYSTTERRPLVDFYTAVDDHSFPIPSTNEDGEEALSSTGASFTGHRQYSSGTTMVVQARIQVDLLLDNAGVENTPENLMIAKEVILDAFMGFSKPFAGAAGQGSFMVSPRPHYLVVRRGKRGAMFDMAGAFLEPSNPGTTPEEDAHRLTAYMDKMDAAFQEIAEKIEFSLEPREGAYGNLIDFRDALAVLIDNALNE